VRRRYDAIVIDCPPGLSLLQLNALVAADWYLVPVSPQYLALEGVAGVLAAADRARERFALRLRLLGMLVTMMDARSASARAVVRMLRGYYRDAVFRSEIPFATALADAPSFGRTIFQHQHASPAGEAYRRLFTEILRRVDRRPARGN
jgi:chromosome partitioning protein